MKTCSKPYRLSGMVRIVAFAVFLLQGLILHAQSGSPAVKYAKGFEIRKENEKTIVTVKNPWKEGSVMASYTLVQGIAGENEISIPMDNIAVLSATQLNGIEKLNKLEAVTGISEAGYIQNEKVKELLLSGKIIELAAGGAYFTEKILKINPSAIFYSPYESSRPVPAALHTIPFIPYLDYMEPDPLGRAEWIKFTAVFLGKEKEADSIFKFIEREYLKLKKLAATVKERPSVFSGKYFNGQWFVAGGKSYIARLFEDAGARYVFRYINKEAGIPLDFETVWTKARNAGFWRITGGFGANPSYKTIEAENYRYALFKAFKTHHILYCDPQTTAYFEKSPLTPHLILADFIKAFHPRLLPGYKPVYYKLLKR